MGGTGAGVQGDGDVLDPAEVYILGHIEPGICNSAALVDWQVQDEASLGFDCSCEFQDAVVRPTDGRLLMRCFQQDPIGDFVREFRCDDCPWTPPADGELPQYPVDPETNDPTLPNPCQQGGGIDQIDVTPDGTVLYRCNDLWYSETGAVLYDEGGDDLVHAGYDGRALTETRIVELGSATSIPLVGLPDAPIIAARVLPPDGYQIVLYVGQGDTIEDQDDHELWHVDAAGVAMLAGVYPDAPAPYGVPNAVGRLEASGALLQLGSSPEFSVLVRREPNGASEVVYTDEVGPLVKVKSQAALITGP